MFKNLEELIQKIKKQKNKNPKISYTASLMKKGKNFCIKNLWKRQKNLRLQQNIQIKKYNS